MAIEREGAARYAEFAELMDERGEEATAALFERLAQFDVAARRNPRRTGIRPRAAARFHGRA
ncbi:MAG: hypothetical protein MZW92_29255 [Comamonadaceae bacterium]|nr:hypothetical protein [Comamonadaceae bacterium]